MLLGFANRRDLWEFVALLAAAAVIAVLIVLLLGRMVTDPRWLALFPWMRGE